MREEFATFLFATHRLIIYYMSEYNFNNKTFVLLQNSIAGEVTTQTIFKYQQTGNLVTADYTGGSILYGKIIALLNGNHLEMLYQCVTTENELKAGKALAAITLNTEGKIKLSLNWQWLTGKNETGESEYIEITETERSH
jgi:hypothetical protein